MGDEVALRVLSYNLHSQRDDGDALAAVVREIAPDVAVLQEAPRRWRWRVKCASLAHDFGMVVAGGGLPSLGNLVLTTLGVRVHGVRCLSYPLTPGRHMRGAVLVDCSLRGTRFTVAGSHLATDPVERPAQAARLAEALAQAAPPVILGVDVNEQADGSAWRLLAEGWRDVGAAGEIPTFPAAAPGRRIDAVFVDPAVTVRAVTVPASDTARRASDHLPLVVDLVLPGPPAGRVDRERGAAAAN